MFPATPEGSGRITHKKMNLGDYIIPAGTQAMVQQEDRNTYKHIETHRNTMCICLHFLKCALIYRFNIFVILF